MFGIFNKKEKKVPERSSASIAKERLQISIKRQKSHEQFDFLPKLEQDILELVKKYIQIRDNDVNCEMREIDDEEILELNITFPSER
jgi:cell division topological specificity factor